MAYKTLDVQVTLKGALLAMVHALFPGVIPSVRTFAAQTGVAASTFTRAAAWLEKILPGLFRARRPGPPQAVAKLDELRKWLKARTSTQRNRCYDGDAKQRIAELTETIHAAKTMTYDEIAAELGIPARQLLRIRKDVKAAGGKAPEAKSRRPQECPPLAREIQLLIGQIEISADTREPRRAIDIKRILEKKYPKELKKYHGTPRISATTVAKYMGQAPPEKPIEHPRGSFVYPEPFEAVAIDTSYYTLFGVTFYLITVFELGGRLNLLTRIFLHDNTEAVVTVLEEFLARYPGVGVVVIDRGTPYLNEEVRTLLELHGTVRLVCPPQTPTAKAAIERHFGTLKEALAQAVDKVFAQDPGWSPPQMAKALELGVDVFATMYHRIPQDGIDGLSPLERIAEFDAVAAAACRVRMFERALNAEPNDLYARHIHRFFQLPWKEAKTVGALRVFSTEVLRKLLEQVTPIMGPPVPDSIREPLDFLVARAREIRNALWGKWYAEEWRDAQEKRRHEAEEREKRDMEQRPESHVGTALENLIASVRTNLGINGSIRRMRELLLHLAPTMDGFLTHEIARLKESVAALTATEPHTHVVERVAAILDELAAEVIAT
jgi:transposase InsO family protein